jgi:hypothetical protein
MAKHQPVIRDLGPPERRAHNIVRVEQDVHHRTRLRVMDQFEIDRLLYKRLISLDEHTSAENLFRDLTNAGYIRGSQWSLDANIKGDPQGISRRRSDALVRVGMAHRWLHTKIGRDATRWLVNVCLGAVRVGTRQLPKLRQALRSYRDFESAWHNYDGPRDLPSLLVAVK